MFYIGFYGFLLYIAICISYQWFEIVKRHIHPVYFRSNWARFIFGSIALILMTVDKGFDPANHFLYQIWKVSPEIVFILSSWGLLFDPGLNIARGKDIDYQGKTSGWLDKLPKWAWYALKAVCLVVFIISIIILLR